MTRLGRAVTERLRGAVSEQDVEAILLDARVSTSAATPTPVRLRVTEVTFSGVKRLERPADDGSEVVAAAEPFDFSWTLGSGLHVVGSHENLRGKSSVLEVIRWALRGRSRLQEDVHSWLERVRVTFQVGQDRLIVDFTLRDGQPHGAVHRDAGGDLVELIRFDSEDAFEQAMDAVMMPRLQLQRIAAWQDEQAIENAWVAYAGALSISSRGLEYLLGDVKWSGMPSRLLSMFVGAAWAASRFEAATAVKATEAALARLQRQADEREEASAGRRAEAASAVEAARTALAALPDGGERLQQIEAAVSRVGVLGAEVAALRVRLDDLRGAEQDVRRQLQEERSRKHALLEDALGRRFFNALRPTACPRCAAPVTDDRRAQEAQGHVCSMCTAGLDLDAFDHQVLVATSAPDTERQAALRSASLTETPDGEEDEAEGEEALQRALQEATARADRVEAELHARSGDREQAAALARAQGALDALQAAPTPDENAERQALEVRRTVLRAAEKVTSEWVQVDQRDVLKALSDEIATLARDFGIPQLTSVDLGGGATLKVHKGGVDTVYSRCTPGEQLRLKVATAVALLRAGFTTQIGRHPGLLTIDSPGSEEATRDSLDAMLHALEAAAADSPDMQVIVATTRTDLLEELIPEERRRVAPPGGYLW